MKSPPDRSGITFEVGAQLEARDRHKNWYTASIEKIDYEKEKVLIHYRQWSRRYDEWFPWSSPYLRPLERVSLRRQGLNKSRPQPLFRSGTKVLACWTDCRFYPAKVLKVNKDDSYRVRFYDGVVLTVKPTKVKPFQEKAGPENSPAGSEGWEEGESEEEEEKRKAEPSSSPPPAKKKTDDRNQNQPTTTDSAQPASPDSAHTDRDVLLERQAHLPTTHKFSREPLYRVIKNQPPPILSIELDHNLFKCPAPGCTKSFRKGSLLHSHIKYYHSDRRPEEPGGEQETPRRKRSPSEGRDFLSERRKENQNSNTCHHDNREHSAMGTEVKKEGGREKEGGQDRKERRNFLRVKLKKKKKKKKSQSGERNGSSDDENTDSPPATLSARQHNTHTHADDASDWSTLTAESDEDTHPWSVAMETEEREVMRCVCEVNEENDFMIQCVQCLCWQHGTCMGLYEDNVPHNYICYCCRDTAGWRRAQHFLPDPDWLTSGRMFGLSCVKENYAELNASKISHTNRLLAHTHGLNQVLKGLQLKISLLHSPSHPDLQLWRLPWRQEEEPTVAANRSGEAPERADGFSPVCYVSSEHCYQKPGASWEKAGEREKETQTAGLNLDLDQNQNHEDQGAEPEDVNKKQTDADTHTHTDTHTHPAPPPGSVVECQLNLLQHIESLHNQISARMDLIESELDVLESWLDHSGELQPPDPLSRLPQLKQRIRRLLRDLGVVRRLSVCR
uniref:PHD finger protein 20-like n=1 Tax=Centroberyx gerrardi TaxID=166262 RepID=UPI003AAE4396